MKYDNYNGWYKWVGLDSYTCQKCDGSVPAHKRMRHIGNHLSKGETNVHCVGAPA